MPVQDLGTITTKQKMIGVKLVAQDANGNVVPSFNGLSLTATPVGVVSFANQTQTSDLPADSTFTVDIVGQSVGQATIVADGQQGNFQPHFDTSFTIEVTLDPSTPGPPTTWIVTPGTIVSQ